MKIFYNKTKNGIVIMVLLAMMLQIVGPVVSNVYAEVVDDAKLVDGDFQIIPSESREGKVTVNWEYVFKPGEKMDYELNLGSIFDKYEVKSGDLEAAEGIVGTYEISEDGKITITIADDIEKIVEKLRGEVEVPEEQDKVEEPVLPTVPEDDTIIDDGNVDGSDVIEGGKTEGSEVVDEAQENEELDNMDSTDDTQEPVETGSIGKPLVSLASMGDIEGLDLGDGSWTFSGSFEVWEAEIEVEQSKAMTFAIGKDLGNIFTVDKLWIGRVNVDSCIM